MEEEFVVLVFNDGDSIRYQEEYYVLAESAKQGKEQAYKEGCYVGFALGMFALVISIAFSLVLQEMIHKYRHGKNK